MNREDVKALYYIAPIANLRSILDCGILCRELVTGEDFDSFALEGPQGWRASRRIDGTARTVHTYANLYVNARNVTLYRAICDRGAETLCILEVDSGVLELPGVVIVDGNAASPRTRCHDVAAGLASLDKQRVFTRYWIGDDALRIAMCAEVLVPDYVHSLTRYSRRSCRPRARGVRSGASARTPVEICPFGLSLISSSRARSAP